MFSVIIKKFFVVVFSFLLSNFVIVIGGLKDVQETSSIGSDDQSLYNENNYYTDDEYIIHVCQLDKLRDLIRAGRLSESRILAYETFKQLSSQTNSKKTCQDEIRKVYVSEADQFFLTSSNSGVFDKVLYDDTSWADPTNILDEPNCWSFNLVGSGDNDDFPTDLWEDCCSNIKNALLYPRYDESSKAFGTQQYWHRNYNDAGCYKGKRRRRFCCTLFYGSSAYLFLPLLNELFLSITIETDDNRKETYNIQQDGILRKYDSATVLWPTAYLLSLCVASPHKCSLPEVYHAIESFRSTDQDSSSGCTIGSHRSFALAVELGAGMGLPSITLARTLERFLSFDSILNSAIVRRNNYSTSVSSQQPFVIATDQAPQALALVKVNAQTAMAMVQTVKLDHFNVTALEIFKQAYAPPGGFPIVLGSSLHNLFDDTTHINPNHQLWIALDTLLADYSSNPNAIAILSHNIYHVRPFSSRNNQNTEFNSSGVASKFQLSRTISGEQYGMKTRRGESSEFQISVYTRTNPSSSITEVSLESMSEL